MGPIAVISDFGNNNGLVLGAPIPDWRSSGFEDWDVVTLIDGRPEKMTLGSFNWSEQAMSQNLENLMILDRGDVDNRAVMRTLLVLA